MAYHHTWLAAIVNISTAVQRRSRKLECSGWPMRTGSLGLSIVMHSGPLSRINTFLRLNSRYTAASTARNATPQ